MEVGMEMEDIYHEILRMWKEEAVVEIEFAPILSPPFVLYAEKTLALSMKILKPMYLYVYQKFLDECKQYRQTIQANGCALTNTTMTEVLMNSSLVLLTVKADFPMAYNIRKEILQFRPEMERFGQEIQCLHVLFSRHPKSPSAWQHVRWCYSQRHKLRSTLASTSTSTCIAIGKHDNQHEVLLLGNELESEREICRRSAEKYPKNYYAWMHRLWLLPQMTFLQLEDELCFSHDWLYMHVSDHSAMHHFVQVIHHIISRCRGLSLSHLHPFVEIVDVKLRQKGEERQNLMIFPAKVCIASQYGFEEIDRVLQFVQKLLDLHFALLCIRCESETLWLGQKLLLLLLNATLPTIIDPSSDEVTTERLQTLLTAVVERELSRLSPAEDEQESKDASERPFTSEAAVKKVRNYVTFLMRWRPRQKELKTII